MKPEAQKALLEKTRRRRRHLPPFIQTFLDGIEGSHSLTTTYEYTKDLLLFLNFLVVERKIQRERVLDMVPGDLARLRPTDIHDFLSYLSRHRRTFQTRRGQEVTQQFENSQEGRNRKIASLRVFFQYAQEQGWVKENPAEQVEILPKEPERRTPALSANETRILLKAAEEGVATTEHEADYEEKTRLRNTAILHLMAGCGLSVGEVVDLDRQDVAASEGYLFVNRRGYGRQMLILPFAVREALIRYEEERPVRQDSLGPYFTSLQNRRLSPRTIRQFTEKAGERAGLEQKVTPHVLRESFAARHYALFQDAQLVTILLGNKVPGLKPKEALQQYAKKAAASMEIFHY